MKELFYAVIPVLTSFTICVVAAPFVIPILLRLKIGQTEREDGPESHLKKSGTPTMGGTLILVGVLAGALPFVTSHPATIPVLFLTVGFGVIGFIDDYIKVVKKRSLGLTPVQKMAGQIFVTTIFIYYLSVMTPVSLAMRIPFFQGHYLDFGILNIPLVYFVVLGTVNGTNFTDGLDGLASSVTAVVAVFFAVSSLYLKAGIHPIACAMLGALLGFLVFNVYPAKVFMGDTGSLALGGFVAGMAYMMQMPLFILLIGIIYLVEVVSVMMQVSYFKATHGKRIFKMAPIHHHFELCGWSETRVVAVFTIATVLIGLIALLGL